MGGDTPRDTPDRSAEDTPEVEVRRSRRRRRTVTAYRDGGRVIVLIPARMTRAEERQWVGVMLDRLEAQERRRRPSDAELLERAKRLALRYLGPRAMPNSIRWVGNQGARWGSCTPSDASVRLSTRLQGMPQWVVDYVLVHELAHLIEPGHTAQFWSIVRRYPRAERARGYLEGVAAARDLPLSDLADTDLADTDLADTDLESPGDETETEDSATCRGTRASHAREAGGASEAGEVGDTGDESSSAAESTSLPRGGGAAAASGVERAQEPQEPQEDADPVTKPGTRARDRAESPSAGQRRSRQSGGTRADDTQADATRGESSQGRDRQPHHRQRTSRGRTQRGGGTPGAGGGRRSDQDGTRRGDDSRSGDEQADG